MNPSALRVAMLHLAQTEVDTEEVDNTKDKESEQLTLDQKKKVIEDSLDSYYSSVLNAYLRQIDDVGQLMIAAQLIVSQFSESDAPVQEFQKRLGNMRVKVLNAVGDTAMSDTNSLKQKILADQAITNMDSEEIDKYVRSYLGSIRRDAVTKIKKVLTYMNA